MDATKKFLQVFEYGVTVITIYNFLCTASLKTFQNFLEHRQPNGSESLLQSYE